MKIVKGKKTYNAITGDDIIVTRGKNSLKTVDEALENQQNEIDKLKSNMKYIYSYGGVGGTGSGSGSGSGGTSTGSASLIVTLGSKTLTDGSTLLLGKTGSYTINCRVRDNVNAETYSVKIGYGTDIDIDGEKSIPLSPTSTTPNKCSKTIPLEENGDLMIVWYDMNDEILQTISVHYIVKTHTFGVKFKYKSKDGTSSEFGSDNKYFMGSEDVLNPYIEITYRIDLSDISGVGVTYSISDTDVQDGVEIDCGSSVSKTITIPLSEITKDDDDLLQGSNMGTYIVNVDFIYSSSGSSVTDNYSFEFTLIPSDLYIDVRSVDNVLYNTFATLEAARSEGTNGVPERYITQGSYSFFYVTVYEGNIIGDPVTYPVTYSVYDYLGDSGSDSESEEMDDENFSTTAYPTGHMTVEEQTESQKAFEIPFTKSGIKKIVFSSTPNADKGIGHKNDTVKYVYVKPQEDVIKDWSPVSNIRDYYFRANNDENTYSANFPELSSGLLPLELKTSDTSVYTISNSAWTSIDSSKDTTILSFGIQYSRINTEGAEILSIYSSESSTNPTITLYSNRLFQTTTGEICIPYEKNYGSAKQSQYHLIQIVRTKIPNEDVYGTYFYIDGIPESVNSSTSKGMLQVGKIVLNNVNISYNLIDLQYLQRGETYTSDQLVYQYWLKYKSQMMGLEISAAEKKIYNKMNSIKFDGTNVIMSASMVEEISPSMPIPTLMLHYTPTSEMSAEDFKTRLFQGYENGDTAFGSRLISNLYWCDSTNGWKEIATPSFSNSTLSAKWYVKLQGTSTMRNRVKNFSLVLQSSGGNDGESVLMSPNFVAGDYTTFLPEAEWTLKADIADSAHANNTSIGKFVNTVCTKFDTGEDHPDYIKNTLEGFPILMYFQIGDEVFYLGVYNFNLGRSSYYNLGYYTAEDTNEMIGNIITSEAYAPFAFSYGSASLIKDLSIGEIQDNQPQFGFNQYDDSVLFQHNSNGSVTRMFGVPDKKMTHGGAISLATDKLKAMVESVAKAGAYCFANIGKTYVPSMNGVDNDADVDTSDMSKYDGVLCTDKYGKNQVPDIKYQMSYDNAEKISWSVKDVTYDTIKNDPDNLFKCIYTRLSDEEDPTVITPYLDYTSASEYYTICMAFAMVDSVVKNMNIKSWDEVGKNHIAFYDMDCGLGEDNSGAESISYLANMDYWHSEEKNGTLQKAEVDWDYWDNSVGTGFDCKSSYLFAVVKYAQPLMSKYGVTLYHYPQQFWAELRQPEGELRNADYFVDTYFKSGIGSIPTYMAALNYQVKYLYTGDALNSKNEVVTSPLALASSFHGSRVFKVRDWLNKRLHILDVMFNIQDVSTAIYADEKVYIPSADDDTLLKVADNDDVNILKAAFSTNQINTALLSGSFIMNINAPINTPMIIIDGSSSYIYFLSKSITEKNTISLQPTNNQAYQCLGSTEFVHMSMVDPFLTKYYSIITDNLEEIIYKGQVTMAPVSSPFTITSTSVKEISMSIPQFTGNLTITNSGLYGQALNSLDISNSGFFGTWYNLDNLQKLNISSNTSNESITVYGCELLTGENCTISGKSSSAKTTLTSLSISDISGAFTLTNTDIEKITMTVTDGKTATFEISGDEKLTNLTLTGFSSVKVSECPNLTSLIIADTDTNKCKTISIDMPSTYDKYTSNTYTSKLTKFGSSREGIFDFTSYTALEKLTVTGCYSVVDIKIPNRAVKIGTFQNNIDLCFIDTEGKNSVIVLTEDSTFYMCPFYSMYQSWSSEGLNGKDITTDSGNTHDSAKKTRMCIDPDCTLLAYTFNKGPANGYTGESYSTTPFTNTWGQKVYNNNTIYMSDAAWFLNNVVSGGMKLNAKGVWVKGDGLDDAYIDDNNVIHDDSTLKSNLYYDNCCANITSLAGCFRYQTDILYEGYGTAPDLTGYTKLDNISSMYSNCKNVSVIDSNLLSLPDSCNDASHPLEWTEFVRSGSVNMTLDALKHISYRLQELSSETVTLGYMNEDSEFALIDKDETIDIVDYLCVREWTEADGDNVVTITKADGTEIQVVPLTLMDRINSFFINPGQVIDYRNMMNVCPNITSLNQFLNTDLSNSIIDGMLKNAKKLTSIHDSFNHNGDMENAPTIDLFDFYCWGENTAVINLFTSADSKEPGFSVNKTIEYEDFKTIMGLLHNYKKISRLSNIFSYCKINGYDETEEITLYCDDSDSDISDCVMNNITNLNALFYNCSGVRGTDDIPLNIRRSFFKCLPNVIALSNTFNGVHFASPFTYDFFCKRVSYENSVYVKVNDSFVPTKLTTYKYGTDQITDMYHCFYDAKFVECDCWFDPTTDLNVELTPSKDVLKSYPTETTYYTRKSDSAKETISDPTAITDTQNNFTNYESSVLVLNSADNGSITINNHNISLDIENFKNGTIDDIYPDNELDIHPTYCCLPPDILYACSYDCNIEGVFANMNIIGVIPQHLVKSCYKGTFAEMLMNTNILPNVVYHYNSTTSSSTEYQNIISSIPVDNSLSLEYELVGTTDADATVLFRDSDGVLKRRMPMATDEYNKSQFVYVPQGYTVNPALNKAFSFRYNIPANVDLVASVLSSKYNITWPTSSNNSYDSTYSPEAHPELWPHYNQYFFMLDDSVDWTVITNMSSPFIKDSDDKDYTTGLTRVFSNGTQDASNRWWSVNNVAITRTEWYSNTNGYFNVFLNLCGTRDEKTGVVTDCGCMINVTLDKNLQPNLSGFVSGIMTTFLNGRIFNNKVDAAVFGSANARSGKIISFPGFGRNIIFPVLLNITSDEKDDPKVLISYSPTATQLYDFMFTDSTSEANYKSRYITATDDGLWEDDAVKYKVIK